MKFLASFFALALYFVFALADTAEELTYPNPETSSAATRTVPVADPDLTVAHTATPQTEKAGLPL
jgi:hypothetical protein